MTRTARRAVTHKEQTSVGKILTRLTEPITVAEMTFQEVAEVKGRNEEIKFMASKVEDARIELEHLQRVHRILTIERAQFSQTVCREHGLDPDSEHYLDLDTGQIKKTAEPRVPELEPVVATTEENGTTEE